ncbi:YncE family protein [Roseicyclus sp. F158]|uniref:YncE family protein n=1 Tax=Tropicimonas omnivorans TaxID=3075590 RepID=A0ABU3DK39_9RHOB|nr:YncE family protein [Roseicyclus sp. F158]MDT0684080.1 YncE family protein [Roseicyclus sp. F158]
MRNLLLMTATTALTAGVASADIFIPEGNADSILHLADDGTVVARIDGVENVHGLAVAPDAQLLIAGSLSEAPSGTGLPVLQSSHSIGMGTVSVGGENAEMTVGDDEKMTDAEHDAHHGAAESATGSGDTSIVTILDTDTHEPVRKVTVAGIVHHVAVDPSETYALVTHPSLGGVSIIDIAKGVAAGPIATGPNPEYAVADPKTGRFFVSNAGNATISEIDPAKGFVARNIPLETGPKHLRLLSDERLLVAAEADAGFVSLIDADSGEIVERYQIGGELHGVQADRSAIYVNALGQDRVVRIDRATGARDAVRMDGPYHMALTGDGLMVSSNADASVRLLDPNTLETISTTQTNGIAHQIVVAPSI